NSRGDRDRPGGDPGPIVHALGAGVRRRRPARRRFHPRPRDQLPGRPGESPRRPAGPDVPAARDADASNAGQLRRRHASMTTYYVKKGGSDAAAGASSGAAWLTIDRAIATAAADDTVWIGAGVYREQATPTVS